MSLFPRAVFFAMLFSQKDNLHIPEFFSVSQFFLLISERDTSSNKDYRHHMV